MARTLNGAGSRNAAARIAAGDTTEAAWSFSADDGNALLGQGGDNWSEFARWHLGRNTDQDAKTKAGYSYPFGKGGKVYLAALRNIAARASAQGDSAISDRASALVKSASEGKSLRTTKQMVTPDSGDDQLSFLGRCMNDDAMNEAFPEAEDRAAICFAQWDDYLDETGGEDEGANGGTNGMANSMRRPVRGQKQSCPMPMGMESRPDFMARCHADPGAQGAYPDDAARANACMMMWDAHGGNMVGSDQMVADPMLMAAAAPHSKTTRDGKRHSVALVK